MHAFNYDSRKYNEAVASSGLQSAVTQLRRGLDRAVGPTFTQLIPAAAAAGAPEDDLSPSCS